MKNKLIPIIVMLIAFIALAKAYTADIYTNIDSTLKNDYIADTYTNIDSTFGSDETEASIDSCTCPTSGDWTIQCSDNCNIQACDMQTNNVLISGAGTTQGLRNITNATRIRIQGGCVARW